MEYQCDYLGGRKEYVTCCNLSIPTLQRMAKEPLYPLSMDRVTCIPITSFAKKVNATAYPKSGKLESFGQPYSCASNLVGGLAGGLSPARQNAWACMGFRFSRRCDPFQAVRRRSGQKLDAHTVRAVRLG